MKNKQTFEQFVEQANKLHNNAYTYDKQSYENNPSYVKTVNVVCKKHNHPFVATRFEHLRGNSRCPLCVAEHRRLEAQQRFMHRIKVINPSFEILEYHPDQKCTLRCKKHSITFFGFPNNLLKGYGCNLCLKEKKETRKNEPETTNEKNKELDALVLKKIIELRGEEFTQQSRFHEVIRSIRSYIMVVKPKADVDIEDHINNRFVGLDIDYYVMQLNSSYFANEHEESLRKIEKENKTMDKVLREHKKYPGSRISMLGDGTGKHIYFVLPDNTYRMCGDDTCYTSLEQLIAATNKDISPIPTSASFSISIKETTIEEANPEEKKEKSYAPISVTNGLQQQEVPFDWTEWKEHKDYLDSIGAEYPRYGTGVITIHINERAVFFCMHDGKPHVFGCKKPFASQKEMMDYLTGTPPADLIKEIYGPYYNSLETSNE